MSKLLNETFQKHLKLLHKKLNENSPQSQKIDNIFDEFLEKEEIFRKFLPEIKSEIEKMNLELLANLMRERKYKRALIVFIKCFFQYEKIKVIKYFLYCVKIKANYANNRNNQ
mgnify:CR=1 FL=1